MGDKEEKLQHISIAWDELYKLRALLQSVELNLRGAYKQIASIEDHIKVLNMKERELEDAK